MSRRVIKHDLARFDLEELAEFIRRSNPRAALRFLDATEAAFRLLAVLPGLGALHGIGGPDLVGLRCFRVPKFTKSLIFYRPIEGGIEVLRVIHGARDLRALFGAGGDEPT